MNARDIALAESRHERHEDALYDAACHAAESLKLRQVQYAHDMIREWKNKTREQVMFDLSDCEFGGEYLIADIAKHLSNCINSRGKCDFSLLGEYVASLFLNAAYTEAESEITED